MKKLLFMLLALLPSFMMADNVTEERAESIANNFFSSNVKTRSASPSLRMVWNGESMTTRSAAAPAFYVFNNESGKGFVIVSGDEGTTSPILGYSFDQNFNAESMPENLSTWMNGIRSEINEARANQENNMVWADDNINAMTPIKLLKTALWDQRNPYNSELPFGYVTGCPATAIAIVMRYHEWPEKGVGVIPQSNDAVGEVTLGHTYDWANMPLEYTDAATDVQKKQVGILMRDVGAMVRTQYGSGSAGANPEETLPQLMPIYMRYNKSTIRSVMKRDFSDSEWHSMMQKEIDEERPILYGGYSTGGGHQFVLDGYAKDNYYHVNWGWSGVSNGYYLLTVMRPPKQGTGGASSQDGFTMKQDAIIGIQPDANNPGGGHFDLMVYKGYEGKPYGIFSDAKEYKQNVEFNVTLKDYQNKGSRAFVGQIAVAHFSNEGVMKGIICSKITDYTNYPQQINDQTENYYKCTITEAIEDGDYIAGVYKYENPSEWTMIHNGYLERTDCIEKIVIKGEGDKPAPPVTKNRLKITLGDGGYVTCDGKKIESLDYIEAEPNQTFEILIYPNEGYEFEQLLFDGNDYTAFAKKTLRYVTPKITKDSELEIYFKKSDKPVVKQYDVTVEATKGGKVLCNNEEVTDKKVVSVKEGEQVKLTITADEGFELSSVLYNGSEVKSEVKEGIYTTPAIKAAATISVVFKEIDNAINDAEASAVKVSANNGILTVEGAENEMIEIYTLTGAKMMSVKASSAAMNITLGNGAYIVRAAGKSFKVVM